MLEEFVTEMCTARHNALTTIYPGLKRKYGLPLDFNDWELYNMLQKLKMEGIIEYDVKEGKWRDLRAVC